MSAEEGCKVTCRGIPYSADDSSVREFFASCGTVTEVEFIGPEGRQGICDVSFAEADALNAACALSKSSMGDRYVKVYPFQAPVRMQGEGAKVTCTGIPYSADESTVREFFQSCGTILAVEFYRRGSCNVVFEEPAALDAACALSKEYMGERYVNVFPFRSEPPRDMDQRAPRRQTQRSEGPVVGEDGCVAVFLGNLSFDIDEETLRETFNHCGEIKGVRLAIDRRSGKFRGFGHLDFANESAVSEAMKLAGTEVMGRNIRIDFAKPLKPR